MIRVSKSPLKFFQAESLGRRVRDGFRRGQTCVTPDYPRYAQKATSTHRRLSHVDQVRKYY